MRTIYLIVRIDYINPVKNRINLLSYTDYNEAVKFKNDMNEKNDGFEYEIQYINLLD